MRAAPVRLVLQGALAAVLIALTASPAAAQAPGELLLPVTPACISSSFGARPAGGPRASRVHNGMDLPAPAGAWVRAVGAGQVVGIRRLGARGLEVELRHPNGWRTVYAHLGSVAPALATGRRAVAAGEALGRVGRTGVTYGTHLHLELVIDGARVDPAPHFRVGRCGG
ncbi:M23 family metallopeptidase [Muricoccus radiodurans]|uniref:M23 family metallopeptidase n=1 Tax=Muricoccus radiodurans TaxID=2231721 RepID=UPI003CFA5DC1